MEMAEQHLEEHEETNNVRREAAPSRPPDPEAIVETAIAWVEENQTLAVLGAFALGVFIGTMIRD